MQNTDIEKLLMQYEDAGCSFTDMKVVAQEAWRLVKTMPDSHARCLLYAFIKEYEDNALVTIRDNEEAMTYISFKFGKKDYNFEEFGYWCNDRIENFLINQIGEKRIDGIEDLEVRFSDGTEVDIDRIL